MKLLFFNNNGSGSGIWAFVVRTVLTSLAVLAAAWILPGVAVHSYWAAIGAAVVIGLLDNVVRPGIVVATLPLTMCSMGCFLFVINALIILLASWVIRGFDVNGFWNALLFSFLLTIFNYLLEAPNRWLQRGTFREGEPQPPEESGQESFCNTTSNDDEQFDDYEDVTDQDDRAGKNSSSSQ